MSQLAVKKEALPVTSEPVVPETVQIVAQPVAPSSWWRREVTLISVVTAILSVGYAYAFYKSIGQFWFHPHWTTDDALQQVYPFHEVAHPGLFAGDIITDVMKGYLAPLHYWISYGITMLTGDPIMMSHWVMLIQVVLTVGFFFAAIRAASSTVPALLGVTWLLHDRNLMQRLTAGLPRGWAAVILTAFLYFVLKGNHIAILGTLLAGCMLNPPATLVVACAYGLLLIWRVVSGRGSVRTSAWKKLVSYICISPLFAIITLIVVHRPAHIGQMVSFEQATQMPEFSRPRGRFPFVPLNPAAEELRVVGLEAFIGRFYNPPASIRSNMPLLVFGGLALLACVGLVRRRTTVPAELVTYGIAAVVVYLLSRLLAFRLYVPNRHLQIPLALFFIAAFCIGCWKAFHRGSDDTASLDGSLRDSRLRYSWGSFMALAAVTTVVFIGSNWGLRGAANFNYPSNKKGMVFEWIKHNTPLEAVVAGHPTHIDGIFLFGARRGYITTETAHPFYARYAAEVRRRNEISLRAHYASSLEELVTILEPEGITYFVFRREDFRAATLPKIKFFPPLDTLMKDLGSRPLDQYAYRHLPKSVDTEHYPFMPFKDDQSVVIDVQALKSYLQERGWIAPLAQGIKALRQLQLSPIAPDSGAIAAVPAHRNNKVAG